MDRCVRINIEGREFQIPLPEGFRVINFRLPILGEWYMHHNDVRAIQCNNIPSGSRFILAKIPVLRTVKITDCIAGKKVIVKNRRGDIFYLVGWLGELAVLSYPDGEDKHNVFTYSPSNLLIEE